VLPSELKNGAPTEAPMLTKVCLGYWRIFTISKQL